MIPRILLIPIDATITKMYFGKNKKIGFRGGRFKLTVGHKKLKVKLLRNRLREPYAMQNVLFPL
jgi:hypothetical protein